MTLKYASYIILSSTKSIIFRRRHHWPAANVSNCAAYSSCSDDNGESFVRK